MVVVDVIGDVRRRFDGVVAGGGRVVRGDEATAAAVSTKFGAKVEELSEEETGVCD